MTTVVFEAVNGEWFRMWASNSAGGQAYSLSVEDIDRMIEQLEAIKRSIPCEEANND